jgi:hypothetical protein
LTATCEKKPKKLKLENPSKRQEYLDLVDRLIETAYTKAQGKYTKNHERIAWIRAITGLVKAGAEVLNSQDIDDLARRIETLEKRRGDNFGR